MTECSSGRFTDGRVSDHGIRDVYSPRNRWQRCLDVEAALAVAQARLGLIPEGAAAAIAAAASVDNIDLDLLQQEIRRESHPFMPLVTALADAAGDAGEWTHWGAATQNITQTADALQLREAHLRIVDLLRQVMEAAIGLALRTADVMMAGRTHGQHAVPISFGYKVAVWLDQYTRHLNRLHEAAGRALAVIAGGAVGTFASTGEVGLAVQEELARELGLGSMPIASRAINDSYAEYVTVLALIAGTSSQIGREIHTLMKPEFAEAFEPIPAGTVGSSTMPHKRNPQLAQDVLALSAQIRALVPLALEAMVHDHEVAGYATDMMEQALPQAVILTGDLLVRVETILRGLVVDPERMKRNLALTAGLIESERIMMTLAETLGRQKAHDIVYRAAQLAATSRTTFEDALLAEPEVVKVFARQELRALLATQRTGIDELIIEQTVRRARTALDLQ
ncbi:adenylosuccinate lyase family protein [Microbacterium sp. B2969]|uniref:Adenylosuccinate lyase family protein n=1 Tax=Microbacterium alkaliflavum TaxID=3248839 RepID=A0ABW7Q2P3_9MICO